MMISGQYSLPIMLDTEVSIMIASVVLAHCEEELEWCAHHKKPLKLELCLLDVNAIQRLYVPETAGLEIKLAAAIKNITSALDIPYVFFPIMRPDQNTLVFYSRVAYR
jgi:hypothetical protein